MSQNREASELKHGSSVTITILLLKDPIIGQKWRHLLMS